MENISLPLYQQQFVSSDGILGFSVSLGTITHVKQTTYKTYEKLTLCHRVSSYPNVVEIHVNKVISYNSVFEQQALRK